MRDEFSILHNVGKFGFHFEILFYIRYGNLFGLRRIYEYQNFDALANDVSELMNVDLSKIYYVGGMNFDF